MKLYFCFIYILLLYCLSIALYVSVLSKFLECELNNSIVMHHCFITVKTMGYKRRADYLFGEMCCHQHYFTPSQTISTVHRAQGLDCSARPSWIRTLAFLGSFTILQKDAKFKVYIIGRRNYVRLGGDISTAFAHVNAYC